MKELVAFIFACALLGGIGSISAKLGSIAESLAWIERDLAAMQQEEP